MKADLKLLELAAKAAGLYIKYPVFNPDDRVIALKVKPHRQAGRGTAVMWNPLTDDGDALRLAVKLRLHFSAFEGYVSVSNFGRGLALIELVNDAGDDGQILAAARKAIVYAAAEIGKAMP